MLHDFRNEDEIAFVLGHEYGHHLARHLEKQKDQAVATAIIAGALVAGVNIIAAQGTSDYDAGIAIDTTLAAIMVGYALGQHAYSQSFELEADTIGAHIATEAGYDAVRGARFFARPEPETRGDGLLSFWGTHPPDDTRVATVIAQTRRSTRGEGLTRREIAP